MIRKPSYKKVLFISDIHAPFHDSKAVNALISFARWWKPQIVFFLGDVVDFYAISKFQKDPKRALELQLELDSAKEVLKRICDVVPTATKHLLRGNHEQRLQAYLWTRASELSGLEGLLLENLLGLNELGIKYHKNGRLLFRGTLIKHGDLVRKFCAYTAKGEFDSTNLSGVSCHTHRLGVYSVTNEAGDFTWMECGHLCDPHPEYMEGKTPNWQQGFGLGFFKDGSKRFDMDFVRIINHKAMYAGMEFS